MAQHPYVLVGFMAPYSTRAIYFHHSVFGCSLKWWYPQNTPKWSFLVGKLMVVGETHHFRKHPKLSSATKNWTKNGLFHPRLWPRSCYHWDVESPRYRSPETHPWSRCKLCTPAGCFFPPGGCGAKLQRFFQWFWVVCDLPNLICCNSDFFRPEKFSDSGTFPTKNHTHSSFMEDFLFFKFTCLVPEKSSSKFWGFGGWEGHLFQEKACKKSLRYYPPS